MKLLTTLSLLLPLTSGAALAPRAEKVVEFWTDEDCLGFKLSGIADPDECVNFDELFAHAVTSTSSQPGFRCSVYLNKDCGGLGFSFDDSCTNLPPWIDNASQSWKCETV